MDADKGVSGGVEIDGIHGAGTVAFPAADAEVLPHDDTAAFPL